MNQINEETENIVFVNRTRKKHDRNGLNDTNVSNGISALSLTAKEN